MHLQNVFGETRRSTQCISSYLKAVIDYKMDGSWYRRKEIPFLVGQELGRFTFWSSTLTASIHVTRT